MNRKIYLGDGECRAMLSSPGWKGSVTVVLFDESGHLMREALDALHDGVLDEKQRIAVSEHLCICDECLERYTDTLCDETLMEPLHPVAPAVAASLGRRGRQAKGLCAKGLVVAVCLAAGVWLMALLSMPARREPVQIASTQADRLLLVESTAGNPVDGSGE